MTREQGPDARHTESAPLYTHAQLKEKRMKKRFYVTMTWDNWPEGGSFGTVVEASDQAEAEDLCRQEMAAHRAEESADEGEDADYYLSAYGGEWHVVDCFLLDDFIARHSPFRAFMEKVAALDDKLDEEKRPPTGDDYNDLCKLARDAFARIALETPA